MFTKKLGLTAGSVLTMVALLAGCGSANSSSSGGTGSSNGTTAGSNTGAPATTGSKTVNIGYITWDEDVAATYLWKNLLEQKGYTVNLQQLEPGMLFAGLSKNNLNLFFDTWLPVTHKQYMDRYGADLTNLGQWYDGKTQEGFVVPTYMKNVNSISDLSKISNQIQGKITGIEAGAGETGAAQQALKTYNLPETLQTSSTPAMLTALQKAYEQKQPIVVTLWSPHWAFAKYDLKYLKDPKAAFGTGEHIQTEANKDWASSNPTVAGWIKKFKLNQSQLGTLEEDINQASSKDAGVQKWIKDNQTLVNSWLS
ncbi:glycine betaine ABC transporter substrate-binding protein [Alicyclobacillus dauci]|uniref:Glycine betaine ABC transporter substrate-binding protein n=1 Tax=Alicyclobacillus dauci TaxID=1475485 RepID=A0ABY6Z2J6_9BACL|nr:glycine betaine ABC transporter substrate-binding protein [Alicyclobacillus dauci]WAH36509.1 glycine betaine ABC transporter substrate-binding protein [Alicyclobacillus dauci]